MGNGLNPQARDASETTTNSETSIHSIEEARVTRIGANPQSDGVFVVPSTLGIEVRCDLGGESVGSVSVPEVGDTVLIGHRVTDAPVLVGTPETVTQSVAAGERVLGHSGSQAVVSFQADGTVSIQGDDGTTVTVEPDGDVRVDGGSTQPVVDISTTTDADGHVTSVSVTRANGVYLPSQ